MDSHSKIQDELVDDYTKEAREKLSAFFQGKVRINDASYLQYLQRRAAGCCPTCEASVPIKTIEKIENGKRVTFECGHGDILITIEETIGIKESFRLSTVAAQTGNHKEPLQMVKAVINGFKISKEQEEKLAVERLCKKAKPHLHTFSNEVQDSAVDVIASGESETELFQVTKLYEKRFWEQLMVNDHTEFVTKSIVELVADAVQRKLKYDKREITKLNLVIDTWPGISDEYVERIRSQNHGLLEASGYREIWLVGQHDEVIQAIFTALE